MTGFRTPEPRGATLAFQQAVQNKLGAPFVRSWLGPRTCRFTDTTVFTLGLGVARLRQHCERELAAHNVSLKECADVTEGLRREADASDGGKRKVGQ